MWVLRCWIVGSTSLCLCVCQNNQHSGQVFWWRQDEHTSALSSRGSRDLPRTLHSATSWEDTWHCAHQVYSVGTVQRLLPASLSVHVDVICQPSQFRTFTFSLLSGVIRLCRCICVTSPTDNIAIRSVRPLSIGVRAGGGRGASGSLVGSAPEMRHHTDGLQPIWVGQINLREIAKFSGSTRSQKMKNTYFLHLLNEKRNLIRPATQRDEVRPEISF